MLKPDLTEIINQDACLSNGVVHHFEMQWVASEPRFGRRAHYFAAVKAPPDRDGPKTVHLCRRSCRGMAPGSQETSGL